MQKSFEKYRQIVVFDIETTGFDPQQEDAIEFAAVVLTYQDNTFKQEKTINEFIKPNKMIPQKITDLTSITEDMVAKEGISQQAFSEIVKDLFTSDSLVVAYNIQFDIGFIVALMKKYHPDFVVDFDLLDLLTVYRAFHKYPHRLESAIEKYDIKIPNSHRAIDDTLATAELLKIMHKEKTIVTYINCIGYFKKYGLKGTRFDHIKYITQ